MKRMWMACVAIGATAVSVSAQQPAAPAAPQAPPTFIGGMKRSWDNVKRNVSEAAEKMPEANYSFKPAPDVRTFGELIAHIAASQYSTCGRAKGVASTPEAGAAEKQTTKAEIVKALQGSIVLCDEAFAGITDESAVKPITVGQNQAIPANLLWGNTSHSNEHYGNIATYMRLKGLVPPSTERTQKPQPKPTGAP
jgi:uncharacterized damage-inducible protein DinB